MEEKDHPCFGCEKWSMDPRCPGCPKRDGPEYCALCGCSCGRCRHQGGHDDHTRECEERYFSEYEGPDWADERGPWPDGIPFDEDQAEADWLDWAGYFEDH